MAFFDTFLEVMTDKPLHLKAPFFYKKDSDAQRQLAELTEVGKTCSRDIATDVEQDIRLLSYGIAGEEQVAFELANSYLPMIVLHDLHIESDGLSAQIDFLVITTKFNLVIECKNLYGNIEVNSGGDFIRKTEYKGRYNKEGIYSPITQNIRHLEMIRKVRGASKNNYFAKSIFEKNFDANYKSVVVLANSKTIIDLKYAKKEIKSQIIRCDQLVDYIKNLMKESNSVVSLEKNMYELADFYVKSHTPNTTNYLKKYGILEEKTKICEPILDAAIEAVLDVEAAPVMDPGKTAASISEDKTNVEDTSIYKALKKYRFETCKSEGVQAYCIFNNAQMLAVISAMPATLTDLKKISGFGDVKCQKYGAAILEIVRSI